MSISFKGTKIMSTEFSNMKVVDLKRELRLRGLSTSGVKEELIERLNAHTTQKLIGSSSEMDGLGESMIDSEILDEDDVLKSDLDEDEEEEVLEKMATDSISKFSDPISSPIEEDKSTEKVEENPKPESAPTKPPTPAKKKIVLVRKSSVPILGNDYEKEKEEKPESDEKGSGDDSNSKVIKLTGYTEEERKEMRAKKFGVVDEEEKKVARAARFGLNQTVSTSQVSIDTLKKRAERFGEVVSPLLTKSMLQEQMEARKRRFGDSDVGKSDDIEEKKRLRAERFKVSA